MLSLFRQPGSLSVGALEEKSERVRRGRGESLSLLFRIVVRKRTTIRRRRILAFEVLCSQEKADFISAPSAMHSPDKKTRARE
jgi:hypothetical protein